MTVAMRTISGPLEDEERQKALFEGTLLIFKNVEHLATGLRSFRSDSGGKSGPRRCCDAC
jgi:hypothetical protein